MFIFLFDLKEIWILYIFYVDQSVLGGICWSSISNGRCKELLSQGVTKENCCAFNAAAATAYSDEDLDSGSLFFWRVLGGGVQCRPCRGTYRAAITTHKWTIIKIGFILTFVVLSKILLHTCVRVNEHNFNY